MAPQSFRLRSASAVAPQSFCQGYVVSNYVYLVLQCFRSASAQSFRSSSAQSFRSASAVVPMCIMYGIPKRTKLSKQILHAQNKFCMLKSDFACSDNNRCVLKTNAQTTNFCMLKAIFACSKANLNCMLNTRTKFSTARICMLNTWTKFSTARICMLNTCKIRIEHAKLFCFEHAKIVLSMQRLLSEHAKSELSMQNLF